MRTLKEKQEDWVCRWQDFRDEKAYMKLEESLMGLVYTQIAVCAWSNVERDDLVSAGRMGIVIAADKYDRYRAGAMISASAAAYIKSEVMTAAQRGGTVVSFAQSGRERLIQRRAPSYVSKFIDAGLSQAQAIEYAAESLNVDPKHIADLLNSKNPVFINDDESQDFLSDDTPDAINVIQSERLPDIIEDAISGAGLNAKEAFCVRFRFLNSDETGTYDAMVQASGYGVSRERMRQSTSAGLKKLEKYFKRQRLELSDLL